MGEHLVGEERGVQPLSLQPALHVGERHHHRVDLAVRDQPGQGVDAEQPWISRVFARTLAHRTVSAVSTWLIGPVNHFFTERCQKIHSRISTPPTSNGV